MAADFISSTKVPALVVYCQRVAGKHAEFIPTLGQELSLRYDLVKPILQQCEPHDLLRLERGSTRLQHNTQELWKILSIKKYSIQLQGYLSGDAPEPESWRDHYFVLQKAEAKHLEEVGSRLRSQRLEHEQQKKEREVKITDQVPPQKRLRPCKLIVTFIPRTCSHATLFLGSGPGQPKTLMQRTYSEASKLHKTVYNARFTAKGKPLSKPPSVPLLPTPSPNYASRVTVTTVKHRQPTSSSLPSNTNLNHPSSTTALSSTSFRETTTYPPHLLSDCTLPPDDCGPSPLSAGKKPKVIQKSALLNQTSPPRPKKNPMTSMFMPKDRAYSQRPTVSR
ncbi:uncharacterized protein BT62DRAFT_750221 [Guyanagaster necrorhizus]|uniref:Elongin-A n=1 Tax=Guyanagaster necrorhizus TaxID=856835 RepID=A0A9P7VW47_9AGAR|nr:uncharacterized protein BT62DRAFT_750221 [Guyanagaster necrorhizus MCA 3950]KAG7448044.1 hypothetical protein BT62DRAFT_750221 [Guyanagaster necrorhizus MCA 3950]